MGFHFNDVNGGSEGLNILSVFRDKSDGTSGYDKEYALYPQAFRIMYER